LAKEPAPETGSHPSLMAKRRIRMGPQGEVGNDRPKRPDYAEQAVVQRLAALGGAHAGGDGENEGYEERCQALLQRVGIAAGLAGASRLWLYAETRAPRSPWQRRLVQ